MSLFEVSLPNYAEEGKEVLEDKLLTRKDMFKVFDSHYYFCYTVYEHYYQYVKKYLKFLLHTVNQFKSYNIYYMFMDSFSVFFVFVSLFYKLGT